MRALLYFAFVDVVVRRSRIAMHIAPQRAPRPVPVPESLRPGFQRNVLSSNIRKKCTGLNKNVWCCPVLNKSWFELNCTIFSHAWAPCPTNCATKFETNTGCVSANHNATIRATDIYAHFIRFLQQKLWRDNLASFCCSISVLQAGGIIKRKIACHKSEYLALLGDG